MPFASRAGTKLDHALTTFGIDVARRICADLGSNVGGFVDCLLQRGALKVYSIDTGYGVLDWKLRNDERVIVMERTNAIHVQLSETVTLVTIDVAWTRQRVILPAARLLLDDRGDVLTLVKPHYEAEPSLLRKGVLRAEHFQNVVNHVRDDIGKAGFHIVQMIDSPIKGAGGNAEMFAWLRPATIA